MEEMSTKEFNIIYKKYFKEYFDKPLKADGFIKKGTINFYRINKLGLIECLNFQRHYDRMTLNFGIFTIYCNSVKSSITIGGRLYYNSVRNSITIGGRLEKLEAGSREKWWDLKNEAEIQISMKNIQESIKTVLYNWFKINENEENYIKTSKNKQYELIYEYIFRATTAAKFKKYDKILENIEEVKKAYESFSEEIKKIEYFKNTLNEALLLEEKLKEGHEAVDEYIKEREKQSLVELGLEKLIK